jgi:hypothetical protein
LRRHGERSSEAIHVVAAPLRWIASPSARNDGIGALSAVMASEAKPSMPSPRPRPGIASPSARNDALGAFVRHGERSEAIHVIVAPSARDCIASGSR